jgi:probable addiction module antidote protein
MGKEKELTTYKADLLEDLRDPEYAAVYLESALEGGSPEQFLLALRDVAEARKISTIAQVSNLNRENLYKMLSVSGNPRLKSLTAILDSVGLRLSVVEALDSAAPSSPPTGDSSAPQIEMASSGHRREPPLNPGSVIGSSEIHNAFFAYGTPSHARAQNAQLVGVEMSSRNAHSATALPTPANNNLGNWSLRQVILEESLIGR